MGKGEIKAISWLLKNIKEKYPDAKILLFGSRARGDQLESSDYDLLVLSDKFEDVPFTERIAEIYELVDRPVNVEMICLTHGEFLARKNELSIVGSIAKECISVL